MLFWGRRGTAPPHPGMYVHQGGTLQVVADESTLVPGTSSTFTGFSTVGYSTDGAAHTFVGASAQVGGVFARQGQQIEAVVTAATPVPGAGGATFGNTLGYPSRSGTTVTFVGAAVSSGSRGVYRSSTGVLSVVVDVNTPMPQGGGNFAGFERQVLSGSTVAFSGVNSSLESGIYTIGLQGGPVGFIADTNTPIPGGQGTFTRVANPSIDGTNVAFLDYFNPNLSGRAAVYARLGGSLLPIAVPGTVLPGGGIVEYCDSAAISGDSVAFIAYTATDRGIFVWRSGQIQTVIRSGTKLAGLSVDVFRQLTPEAFEGDTLAFCFNDALGNLGGVYTATIPAPAALSLLLLAALPIARRRRS